MASAALAITTALEVAEETLAVTAGAISVVVATSAAAATVAVAIFESWF
jgi:hypothetical protein